MAFKEADGSYAGEIAVKNPQVIGVDPASGAVYVCAYTGTQTADLIKFSGLEDGKELYRIKLPTHRPEPQRRRPPHRRGRLGQAGAHLAAVTSTPAPTRLYCIEDAGDKFVDKGDPRSKDLWAEGPATSPSIASAARSTSRPTATRIYRLDDADRRGQGRHRRHPLHRALSWPPSSSPGQDGNLYAFTWNKGLWRLDRDGKPT